MAIKPSIQCIPSVKILADSISAETGIRIVTFQLEYWRAIHAEVMTHRVFSRNAGSSRARPTAAIIKQVRENPWGPQKWGENRPGMQAKQEIQHVGNAVDRWRWAALEAAKAAEGMLNLGLHKQVANRLLEPFSSIHVVLTSTHWDNFFELRDHLDAMPEIQTLARKMRIAMHDSTPTSRMAGDWHLPYITPSDWIDAHSFLKIGRITRDEPPYAEKLALLRKASAARCARVSYKPFDGEHVDLKKDLELFEKLAGSTPIHASPLEHQATPITDSENDRWQCGNFHGWKQFRHLQYKPS